MPAPRKHVDLTGFDVHPRRGGDAPFATGKFDLARYGCPKAGDMISMNLDGEVLTGTVLDDGSVTLRPRFGFTVTVLTPLPGADENAKGPCERKPNEA